MEIKRSDLVRMVAEEVRAALREVSSEADDKPEKDDEAPKKKAKGGKRPETKDASDEPTKRGPGRPKGSKNKQGPVPPPGDNAAEVGAEDPVAAGEEPEDADLPGDDEMAADNVDAAEDEEDALDGEGDADEEGASGEINDAIQGLSVQSVTIEPESLLLPGSKEVVFTFNDTPDVLRILVDQVGNVVFSWNGQLHDIP